MVVGPDYLALLRVPPHSPARLLELAYGGSRSPRQKRKFIGCLGARLKIGMRFTPIAC